MSPDDDDDDEYADVAWRNLFAKYSHRGCPAEGMEDNCAHPGDCADNGRCLGLPPLPHHSTSEDRE